MHAAEGDRGGDRDKREIEEEEEEEEEEVEEEADDGVVMTEEALPYMQRSVAPPRRARCVPTMTHAVSERALPACLASHFHRYLLACVTFWRLVSYESCHRDLACVPKG